MRNLQASFAVVVLLALASTGCVMSHPKNGAFAAHATWPGSVLHVDFQGLIAHNVTDTNYKPWRALLIDTTGVTPPHVALMSIPGVADSALLLNALGTRQSWTDCSNGCDVNIDGLGIQFVDSNGNALKPAFYTGPDFVAVPHLQAAAGSSAFALTSDATSSFPPQPPTGKLRRIAAFLEMTGGILSVLDEYGCTAHFDQENDADSRTWPDNLRLIAYSPDRIVMQVMGPATNFKWQSIEFAAGSTGYMRVFVSNAPRVPNGKSHFTMYHFLSDPDVTLQDVVEKAGCRHPIDTVAGCSNSTFP